MQSTLLSRLIIIIIIIKIAPKAKIRMIKGCIWYLQLRIHTMFNNSSRFQMHMKSTSTLLGFPAVHGELIQKVRINKTTALQTFCQILKSYRIFTFVLVDIWLISASFTVASAQQQSKAGAESKWCIYSPIS